ncbi:helix-turn-helix domain-containing protein (plasmid) [Methylomarinum sp. Ch1-1]|uniref:Helix-turn-helix domain-containing protein n=1 Tax=Methylomarinum roseum TaxID=3067653 RepID=A0AAU7P1A5_9GAMM|nr:helix-turn-helix domain-containing protein [Methylomarinum sp. Ch1-1]MDP4523258.1 helix-turn-helix domain-containing protein [Methylomarinum sp. Ch1-1]
MTLTLKSNARTQSILVALKECCRQSVEKHAMLKASYLSHGDAAAANLGAFVPEISERTGIHPDACSRLLKKLEAEKKAICKSTSGGSTRWWPVGFAQEMLCSPAA